MRWRRKLLLIGLLAIGIADGQAADGLMSADQSTPSGRAPPGPPPQRKAQQITKYVVLERPSSARFYPSLSIKLREQGYVTIKMCFDVRGKPVETAVLESSGFIRLDAAAVKMGSKYRIKPPTVDKVSVATCLAQRIEFTIRDRR